MATARTAAFSRRSLEAKQRKMFKEAKGFLLNPLKTDELVRQFAIDLMRIAEGRKDHVETLLKLMLSEIHHGGANSACIRIYAGGLKKDARKLVGMIGKAVEKM